MQAVQEHLQESRMKEYKVIPLSHNYNYIYFRCSLDYIPTENHMPDMDWAIFNHRQTFHIALRIDEIYFMEDGEKTLYRNSTLLNQVIFEWSLSKEGKYGAKSIGFVSTTSRIIDISEGYLDLEGNFISAEQLERSKNILESRNSPIKPATIICTVKREDLNDLRNAITGVVFRSWRIVNGMHVNDDVFKKKVIVLQAVPI